MKFLNNVFFGLLIGIWMIPGLFAFDNPNDSEAKSTWTKVMNWLEERIIT